MAEAQKASLSGNGGNITSKEMDREIAALRDDMAKLSKHVSQLFSATGSHAARRARREMDRARSSVDSALAEAGAISNEAADAMLEMRDTVADAVEESVRTRPYTTLAMALAAGFVIGAVWRR